MHLKLYLLHQKQEIEKYKWIRGQQLGYDPGEKAVQEWIDKYAEQYRKEYEDVFYQAVEETSNKCIKKLKNKIPGVSDELWDFIFKEIIESFTEVWVKEVVVDQNDKHKKHLEEF